MESLSIILLFKHKIKKSTTLKALLKNTERIIKLYSWSAKISLGQKIKDYSQFESINDDYVLLKIPKKKIPEIKEENIQDFRDYLLLEGIELAFDQENYLLYIFLFHFTYNIQGVEECPYDYSPI